MAAGADVIEFDVRMTADDVAIVMHDPTWLARRTAPASCATFAWPS